MKYFSLINNQCVRHAIDIEQEKGYSKYMMLGQLLEGEEAVECFKKGIEVMIKEKQLIEKVFITKLMLLTPATTSLLPPPLFLHVWLLFCLPLPSSQLYLLRYFLCEGNDFIISIILYM